MIFTIALNFEDGVTRFLSCEPNETVAAAAYRNDINIPLGCCNGECGTCKSFLESGKFEHGPYLREALSAEEEEKGHCLPCQMYPKADCVLRINTTSDNCGTTVSEFSGEVASAKLLSRSTIGLSLELDERHVRFLPGQYIDLQVPGTNITRSYSFSSQPGEPIARFLIRNIPNGVMTSYLLDSARPGDQIFCKGPLGGFYLREVKRPILMLAGGTGLAPLLSMLGRLAEIGCSQPIHLIYGVTNDADLIEVDTLEALSQSMDHFTFTTCVASPDSSHSRKGFVTHQIEPRHLYDGELDIYLCGPPPMVSAAQAFLREGGISPAGFHYERFAASGDT